MMGAGFWIVGALFCLLGTLALVVLAFAAFRYLTTDRPGHEWRLSSPHRSTADTLDR